MVCTYKYDNNIHRPIFILIFKSLSDEVAEWLRRWTANPMGSNPIFVEIFTQSLGNTSIHIPFRHCMYNYIHQISFMIICINLVL